MGDGASGCAAGSRIREGLRVAARVGFPVLLGIILWLAGGAAPEIFPGRSSGAAEAAVPEGGAEIRTENLRWAGKYGDVRVAYPRIVGGVGRVAASALNRRFEADARKALAYGRKVFSELDPADIADLPAELRKGSYESTFEVKRNRGGVLSLFYSSSEYQPGAAHPGPGCRAETWDLAAGRALGLSSILVDGSGWEKLADREVRRQFKGMKEKELLQGQKFPPLRAYRENFYLVDRPKRGIVFFWPVYDFTPYYCGLSEFFIPFDRFFPAMVGRCR
jgi:hypothetical protein